MIKFARGKQPSEDQVQRLFDKLAEEKKKVGEKPVAKDRLAALVKAQIDKFSAEGKAVAFKISTKDGKVTLRTAECLASCGTAPMMQVDKDYYENLTPADVDQILARLQGS